MPAVQETIERVRHIDVDQYKYGFVTDIESDKAPKGLSEDIVRFISARKDEPEWMLNWRLDAYRRWLTMREPQWARVDYGPIDYQDLYYYSAPKRNALASLDEVDPEILKTYAKLGIPLREQEMLAGVEREDGTRSRVAVDARLAADRSPLRRTHGAVHRGEELLRRVRARGDDLEDLRGHAVLLPTAWTFCRGCDRPRGQRLRQGCVAAPPDGVRGRGAEAHFDQPGGKRGMNFIRRPEVLSQRASKDGGPEIACLYRDGDVPLRRAIQRCGAITG
jgi:hypothetical protein